MHLIVHLRAKNWFDLKMLDLKMLDFDLFELDLFELDLFELDLNSIAVSFLGDCKLIEPVRLLRQGQNSDQGFR